MKKLILLNVFLVLMLDVVTAQTSLRTIGGSGDEINRKTCLSGSNIITAGSFTGEMIIGIDTATAQSNSTDLFITSMNNNGSVNWTIIIGNSCNDEIGGIASDNEGNIYITGSFHNFLFVQDTGIMSAGGTDVFIASFNSQGGLNWLKGFGGSGYDHGNVIEVNNETIYAGATMHNASFPNSDQPGAGTSVTLGAFNLSGSILWSICESTLSQSDISIEDITADANGSVYATGYFFGTVYAGDNGGIVIQSASPNIWAGSYNSGITNFIYSPSSLPGNYNSGMALALNNNGQLVITGYCSGSNNFYGNPIVSDDHDIFILSLDPSGQVISSRIFTAPGMQHPLDLVINSENEAVICGFYIGSFAYNTIQLSGANSTNAFAITAGNSTESVYADLSGTGSSIANSVIIDNDNPIISGYYSDALSFINSTYASTVTSSGLQDVFILEMEGMQATTAIAEIKFSNVNAYPNPARDFVNFAIEGDDAGIEIYDLSGRLVLSSLTGMPVSGGVRIDVGSLAPGMYNAIITTGEKTYSSKFVCAQ